MPRPNGHARTKDQREKDLELAASLRLRGLTQRQIAERIGITQQALSQDLKLIRQRWMQDTARAGGEMVAEEIAKINETERQQWVAYQNSVSYKEIKIVTETGEVQVKRQPTDGGDPRFLMGVLHCVDRRAKLLGLEPEPRAPSVDHAAEQAEAIRKFIQAGNAITMPGESADTDKPPDESTDADE